MTKKQGQPPIVFNIQPEDSNISSMPENLKKYEQTMKEEVGLPADLVGAGGGTCTKCGDSDC